jgi:aspartyl protease family protein
VKKLILLSIFVGLCASVPIVYQANPDLFHGLLRNALAPEPDVRIAAGRTEIAAKVPLSGRRVRLEADAKGHFTGGFKLNGRSFDAMVDTGATLVAINRTAARRIGIQISPGDFRYKVRTANGEVEAASARIGELVIGPIRVRDVEAVVLDDSALDATLIGMSFLRRLSSYKVEGGSLILQE